MTLVKICGITNLNDAQAAVAAGADVLGFNFYKPSPRYIAPENAREIIDTLPPSILAIGVFVNEDSPEIIKVVADTSGIKGVQLHGDESPEYCRTLNTGVYVIKAFGVSRDFDVKQLERYEVDAIMLDTKDNRLHGGTGRVFDWSIAQRVGQLVPKLYLAGGLAPENVREAIETVQPYAVDTCSAVEDEPGIKNHERMRVFITTVRSVKP